MLTDRFLRLRKQELDKIFSKKNISVVWRNIVKDQLRRTDILDIFDHYDFNYNIEERAILLRNDLLNGTYQCSLPLIYRIEKKYGICRHLIIPQPIDALILQIITEELSSEIIKKQPSLNAFYSQDKHNVGKPHEIYEYGFHWRELWKKMQKQIYKFSEEKELIIVSDLTNFYDSIDINELRKKITSYVDDKEVLIDILFKIVEKISWLPDYLPYTNRGLPTTNIEGIRLLAHSFLFELDAILKEKSKDSFTRWMDDIVIGVNTREEAIETLSSASDILKSRGLALNLGKTDIYDPISAEFNFLIDENKYLDSIIFDKLIKSKKVSLETELKKRFKAHLKNNLKARYSEKITKRYITAFGKLNSEKLLSEMPTLYEEFPGIRQNLLIHLSQLGYKKKTSDTVLKILDKLLLYDDISLFNICKLITTWDVKIDDNGDLFLKDFNEKINSFSIKRKNPFDFYCLLWVKSKYEHPDKLYNFIIRYENIWQTKPFLRRHVTAIMARLLPFKEDKVRLFLEKQISTGETQIVSIANHILTFSILDRVESKVNMYLFPKNAAKNYPLSKYLVLCSVLNSPKCRVDKNLIKNIKKSISDSYLKKWIEFQYDVK
jgi:hypothetical protein